MARPCAPKRPGSCRVGDRAWHGQWATTQQFVGSLASSHAEAPAQPIFDVSQMRGRNFLQQTPPWRSTSPLSLTMRLSGLQKEVLSLYRNCLRECRKKPEASRHRFQAFARSVHPRPRVSVWSGLRITDRACRRESDPSRAMLTTIRAEFEKNIKMDKKDFGAIEFLLRKGRRQLEVYASAGVKDIK